MAVNLKKRFQGEDLRNNGLLDKDTHGTQLTKAETSVGNTGTVGSTSYQKYQAPEFKLSDSANVAAQNKANAEAAVGALGNFNYTYQTRLDDVMAKILDREKFKYDLNGDALYNQYKDKFTHQGQMAMMDTMGQAQAMTGGYGNSYAQSVGQQAYQANLQNLNDIVPELYQMALDRYNAEGQDMLNQYGLLAEDYNREYGAHTDKYNQALTERDYATNEYYNQYAKDWTEHTYNTGIEQAEHQNAYNAAINEANNRTNIENAAYKAALKAMGYSDEDIEEGNFNLDEEVSDAIIAKLGEIKSNRELQNYLDGLESSGEISTETADKLYAQYIDQNELLRASDEATEVGKDVHFVYDYTNMAKSAKGWNVVDDGGGNLFGIDRNAIVEAPNGEQMTLAQLRKILVDDERKTTREANEIIKELEKRLGIRG